ncbi:MAG: hypothetical protein PHD95_01555, partial [Candidatus ainarchaeum sp.]|nr:hypothetical protein [Candidatus ainarchaeum sp.]
KNYKNFPDSGKNSLLQARNLNCPFFFFARKRKCKLPKEKEHKLMINRLPKRKNPESLINKKKAIKENLNFLITFFWIKILD